MAAGHELAAVFFALRDGAFRTGAHDDLVTGLGLAVIGESMGGTARSFYGVLLMAVKTETEFHAFLATMQTYPDDALLAAAVVTLATRPAGPFGQRTHDELRAEVERRDMTGSSTCRSPRRKSRDRR